MVGYGVAPVYAMDRLVGTERTAPPSVPCAPSAPQDWPLWSDFKAHFITQDGRVIDHSTPEKITTSEGQSYALFFSLVANDRAQFKQLLRWTENNLSRGDITHYLPAWQWGQLDDERWGVMDHNSASDSDLWIAYALMEAGRLWQQPNYSLKGALLAQQILAQEVEVIPGLGASLLPAPIGFKLTPTQWRLNPSYVPLQLIRRLSKDSMATGWRQLIEPAYDLITHSAVVGISLDWALYSSEQGFLNGAGSGSGLGSSLGLSSDIGSYNAIRVYLWSGMLAEKAPYRAKLMALHASMIELIKVHGAPPENVKGSTQAAQGVGPIGFSAALIPLLFISNETQLLQQQLDRINARYFSPETTPYYDYALGLFGLGWYHERYRFDENGYLITQWEAACY